MWSSPELACRAHASSPAAARASLPRGYSLAAFSTSSAVESRTCSPNIRSRIRQDTPRPLLLPASRPAVNRRARAQQRPAIAQKGSLRSKLREASRRGCAPAPPRAPALPVHAAPHSAPPACWRRQHPTLHPCTQNTGPALGTVLSSNELGSHWAQADAGARCLRLRAPKTSGQPPRHLPCTTAPAQASPA